MLNLSPRYVLLCLIVMGSGILQGSDELNQVVKCEKGTILRSQLTYYHELSADAWNLLGLEYINKQSNGYDQSKALTCFLSGLTEDPENPNLLINIGNWHLSQKSTDNYRLLALTFFTRALEISHGNPDYDKNVVRHAALKNLAAT